MGGKWIFRGKRRERWILRGEGGKWIFGEKMGRKERKKGDFGEEGKREQKGGSYFGAEPRWEKFFLSPEGVWVLTCAGRGRTCAGGSAGGAGQARPPAPAPAAAGAAAAAGRCRAVGRPPPPAAPAAPPGAAARGAAAGGLREGRGVRLGGTGRDAEGALVLTGAVLQPLVQLAQAGEVALERQRRGVDVEVHVAGGVGGDGVHLVVLPRR